MEHIPARLLRPLAVACPSAPKLTPRLQQTRAYILEAATGMFAEHGHPHITLKSFAEGCGLAQTTIRRHVCDMHFLFRLVLTAHLDMLLAGISKVPSHHPDFRARARAEYRRLTRDHRNNLTPIHALLVHHRAALPKDQRDPLEAHRRMIGTILANEEWDIALDLLDGSASIDRIEGMLASEPQTAAQRAPLVAPQPMAAHPRPFLGPRFKPEPELAPIETVIAAQNTPPPHQQAA